VLGDWYANLYYTRPQQLALCMSERSLLAVLVPLRETRTLPERFADAAVSLLARVGVPRELIEEEAEAMKDAAFGPTANRKVLGCLNEAAFELMAIWETDPGRFHALAEMEDHLSENIYSTTEYQRPKDLALALFQAAASRHRAH
jgi:hypothetical protein